MEDHPPGLRLRPLTSGDVPAGLRLSCAAGWNQLKEDWELFLHSEGSGGFVAEREDGIVGTAAYMRYGSLTWIAMMLVDPRERRSGIGSRLMEAVLSAVGNSVCVGLDASLLGEPMYRGFGLVAAYELARYKGAAGATRPSRSTSAARRMMRQDLDRVLERDREVFGADREQLLTSLWERAPEYASIVSEGGKVCGFAFGRPGRLYSQFGPIVADNRDTASALVVHGLVSSNGRPLAIDVPKRDPEWLAWLESAGFVEERPFIRMFRRGDTHPGLPDRQYAITGPEFA